MRVHLRCLPASASTSPQNKTSPERQVSRETTRKRLPENTRPPPPRPPTEGSEGPPTTTNDAFKKIQPIPQENSLLTNNASSVDQRNRQRGPHSRWGAQDSQGSRVCVCVCVCACVRASGSKNVGDVRRGGRARAREPIHREQRCAVLKSQKIYTAMFFLLKGSAQVNQPNRSMRKPKFLVMLERTVS